MYRERSPIDGSGIPTDQVFSGEVYPGLTEGLKRIVDEGYAKSVTRHTQTSHNELVGVMMPRSEEQTQHVVIFVSGRALVIEPEDPAAIEAYRGRCAPNSVEFDYSAAFTIDNIAANLIGHNPNLKNKVVLDNQVPEQAEEVDRAIAEALNCASKLKDKREIAGQAAVRASAEKTVALLDEMFGIKGQDEKTEVLTILAEREDSDTV